MRTPLVLLPLLALGVLAACGDDDDSASTTVAAATSDAGEASGGSTAETTATEDTATDDTATEESMTEDTATAGSVNPEFAEWCAKADEISESTATSTDDPAELEQRWPESQELIDEIVELSPDEIADEMAVVQEYWTNIGAALEANDWDAAAVDEAEVTPEGFDEAGEAITAFEDANCGGLS
jgi:hypothetical protein